MIITRTPYRVSFFGGGTDFPSYYEEHGGSVLSCTINRYSYLHCRILPPFFDHKYRIRYFRTERVGSIDEIAHPSVRECLRFLNYPYPLEVLHSGDIPAMSGIGSSSSFTVGFLLALHGLMGRMATKRELALQAIEVEQNRIGEHVGSQDQFAAAFGGFNRIDFGPGRQIRITPLIISPQKLARLQNNLLFCFSGISRHSSEIQTVHIRNIPDRKAELADMKALVDEAQSILNQPGADMDAFGRLLDTAWKIKRRFSDKVTNDLLDDTYASAMRAGALGGKVCGAGGGGFMMFYVPGHRRKAVREALQKSLLVPIRFEYLGAHVIFFAHEEVAGKQIYQEPGQ
ncbi:MAG: kinase [Desulfovibrio sp.]|jgi:D-glycero-alpha-D-manno-heptose-7-phosphate kinase|nr:kinase [Desulfovibrio sp.]